MRSDEDAGPWSRAGPSRGGGGGGFGGDRNRGGYGDRERGGYDRGGGYGDRDRGGYGGDRGGDRGGFRSSRRDDDAPPSFDSLAERPKLNLAPRSLPAPEIKTASVDQVTEKVEAMTAPSAAPPADKWETVFKKTSSRGPAGGSGGYSGRSGGFDRDRDDSGRSGGGYGDRDRGGYGGSSGGYERRGGYGDRDRGGRGYSGSSSNRFETEPIEDPRFKGKFGGGGDARNDGRGGGSSGGGVTSIPILEQPNEVKKAKAAEERKAAAEEKALKAAAKAAEEEEKRQREQAIKDAERAAATDKRNIAAVLVKGGKKGEALCAEIQGMSAKPLGSGLVGEILASLADPMNVKWVSPAEYGSALTLLLAGNDKEQMHSIYEMQKFYNTHGMPKIETKGGPKNIWEVMFHLMYQYEIVENGGFMAWWDDEDEERTELPGRSTALIQATTFINWMQEEEEGDEEEEDDDEDLERNGNR
jgi:hypothetical protein